MAIRHYLQGHRFDAETARLLGVAFEMALVTLQRAPKCDAEHFIRCPACDGWIDCRDLGQVFDHEGPLPHPSQDQPQNWGARGTRCPARKNRRDIPAS